jgi:hypothetical protein
MKIKKWIGIVFGLAAVAVQAAVVYQDDFAGLAGDAKANTTPEVLAAGWLDASTDMNLDGTGKLESGNEASAIANYRFRIATDPLTADAANDIIKWSGTVRTPASQWIAIGFHENNVNNLLASTINSGPFLRFQGNSSYICSGNALINQTTVANTHTAGDVVSVSMEYDVKNSSVDLWINNELVADDVAIAHEYPAGTPAAPVVYWAQIHFRLQASAAGGGAYVDDFKIETLSRATGILFQDDFSGAAGGVLTNSMPEVYMPGFSDIALKAELDGSGKLQSGSATEPSANYHFKLMVNPVTDDPLVGEIRWKANVRMPTNSWIAIGFHGANINNLISANVNSGPFLRFDPQSTYVSQGNGLTGQQQFASTHAPGDLIAVEAVYHVAASTMDVYFDGVPAVGQGNNVATNVTIAHEWPVGTPADPVVDYAQIHFNLQPTAAQGGAYVDDFEVSVVQENLAFDAIAGPANLISNSGFQEITTSDPGFNNGWNVSGSNGEFWAYTNQYAEVNGWGFYFSDPNDLVSYTDAGEVLDGTDKLGTVVKDGSIGMNSSMDYRNGMLQTNIFQSALVKAGQIYELTVDVRQNAAKNQSLNTFTAALTAGNGADATNLVNTVFGSLVLVSPATNLPAAFGAPYAVQISGGDLLAAQSQGQINVLFESLNTKTISGFPDGAVDPLDPEEASQVFVDSLSLILVIPEGDVTKDGVVDQADVDLAQLYLAGDGGLSATNRQDLLVASGSTPAEALAALNLTDFDLNGDDTFDAADVAALDALLVGDPIQIQVVAGGSTVDFVWNSRVSKLYDIVSTTSLSFPDWQPYNDGVTTYENIAGDVSGTNTVTGVQTVGPARFFKVLEKD